MADRIDLDELARLEEERDFLLRSIADLDRELEAGDVDPADYEELRSGYVGRAADVIRAIEAGTAVLAERRATTPRRGGRAVVWTGAVVAFTVVAGVLLANALGSRGEGAGLTGTVPGDDANECRSLSFQKPAEGVECYDKLLESRPDDVDLLTYQGWAKVRAGDVAGGSALFDRVVELDPEFPDVHVFRASVSKDAGDFVGAQAELDTLYSLNPSPIVTSTLQQMGLDREVAVGLLDPAVAACWAKEEAALAAVAAATDESDGTDAVGSEVAAALTDLTESVKCLDDLAATRPDDADLPTLESIGIGLLAAVDATLVDRAHELADRAVTLRPGDPAALLLRAVWSTRLGDLASAGADLDAIGDRRISPLIGQFVDPATVRAEVEAGLAAAAASSTTTTP